MNLPAKKVCIECGIDIVGRVDKKFCTDKCRTSHNNKLHLEADHLFQRMVHRVLKNNRRILKMLNKTGSSLVSRSVLANCGFDFNYITSYSTGTDGHTCFYCYEQGYMSMSDEQYILVTDETYKTTATLAERLSF